MNPPGRNNLTGRAMVIGLWVNAALLAVVLLVLAGRGESPALLPAAFGQAARAEPEAQPGAAAPRRDEQPQAAEERAQAPAVRIVPAQLASGHWGCYVLDLETRHLAVYQYQPGERQLRLIAARDVRHDLKLNDFNTAPSPQEISQLVERQQAGRPDRMDETPSAR